MPVVLTYVKCNVTILLFTSHLDVILLLYTAYILKDLKGMHYEH